MQSGHRSRIILLGTSHKHAPLHIREKLSFSPDTLFGRLRSIREFCSSVEEVVILSTCNRTEIYVVSTDVEASSQWISRNLAEWSHISEPDLTAHLYRLVDEEAVRHLFHVTLGLDSMVLGESQIGAQVRESLKSAKQVGTAGRILSDLFQHALRASGDIRKQTGLATES
ncbi:MAG: glutamyl-tRNA reductase, partial [Candidatus Bathyarchaeia archaeon]